MEHKNVKVIYNGREVRIDVDALWRAISANRRHDDPIVIRATDVLTGAMYAVTGADLFKLTVCVRTNRGYTRKSRSATRNLSRDAAIAFAATFSSDAATFATGLGNLLGCRPSDFNQG